MMPDNLKGYHQITMSFIAVRYALRVEGHEGSYYNEIRWL